MRRRRGRLGRLVRGTAWAGALAVGVTGGIWAWSSGLPVAQAALRDQRFHLHSIDWVGLETLDASELTASLGPIRPTALIDLDVSHLARRVAQHPRVESCDGVRLPPDRLLLRIVERVPLGRVAGKREAFDETGERFPLLSGEEETLVPVRGQPGAAVPLLQAARRHEIDLVEVEAAAPNDLRFRLRGSEVVVRGGTEVDRVLEDWRRLRAAGVIERYRPREVDLRFDGSAVLRGASRDLQGG